MLSTCLGGLSDKHGCCRCVRAAAPESGVLYTYGDNQSGQLGQLIAPSAAHGKAATVVDAGADGSAAVASPSNEVRMSRAGSTVDEPEEAAPDAPSLTELRGPQVRRRCGVPCRHGAVDGDRSIVVRSHSSSLPPTWTTRSCDTCRAVLGTRVWQSQPCGSTMRRQRRACDAPPRSPLLCAATTAVTVEASSGALCRLDAQPSTATPWRAGSPRVTCVLCGVVLHRAPCSGKCSSRRRPLLKLGFINPVRVCEGCYHRLQRTGS